jgi:DNA polymerase-1
MEQLLSKPKENYKVYMVTPDKDFAQLVSKHFMYKPARMGNGIEIWEF